MQHIQSRLNLGTCRTHGVHTAGEGRVTARGLTEWQRTNIANDSVVAAAEVTTVCWWQRRLWKQLTAAVERQEDNLLPLALLGLTRLRWAELFIASYGGPTFIYSLYTTQFLDAECCVSTKMELQNYNLLWLILFKGLHISHVWEGDFVVVLTLLSYLQK